jgi:26S proteasome regulatory subunit N5
MDGEDLGREIDMLEVKQKGGAVIVVDQESTKQEVQALIDASKQGEVSSAIDGLLAIEKRGRLAEEPNSTKLACCSLLTILYEQKNYKDMQEKLVLLTKRRGQLKEVVRAMVRQCMEYVEEGAPQQLDRSTREEIIKTLQSITEGKIYVEIERARITRHLAVMKEEDGDVSEAANILQEVAVETFGSMAKVEKIAYILELAKCLHEHSRCVLQPRRASPLGKSGSRAPPLSHLQKAHQLSRSLR